MDKKCKRAANAIEDLRYGVIGNFKRDVEMCKKRGIRIEVRTENIERLKKFKPVIDDLEVPTTKRVKEILETVFKLEIFGELG